MGYGSNRINLLYIYRSLNLSNNNARTNGLSVEKASRIFLCVTYDLSHFYWRPHSMPCGDLHIRISKAFLVELSTTIHQVLNTMANTAIYHRFLENIILSYSPINT